MSLLYIDGFDAYGTADIPLRWVVAAGALTTNWTVDSSGGRNGTGCLKLTQASTKYLYKGLGADYSSGVIVGLAFSLSALPSSGYIHICGFIHTSITGVNVPCFIGVDAAGNIAIVRQTSGTTVALGQNAANIVANTFYYIEFKCAWSSSTSSNTVQLYLNGTLVVNVAAASNTNSGISGFANILVVGAYTSTSPTSLTMLIDDLYILDSTGSTNTTFLGDIRIEAIRPTAAGNTTQLTPNTGANYAAVDDTSNDSDSTYVSSSTFGQKDTYTMGNLVSAPVSVKAIQVNMTARKDDAGTRGISSVIRSGGTDYDHASTNPFYLADSYTTKSDIWELDPNGSIAWTGSAVDAIEAGIKIVT